MSVKSPTALQKMLEHFLQNPNEKTWIVFHRLLIISSMEEKISHDKEISLLRYTGGLLPAVSNCEMSMRYFTVLVDWMFDNKSNSIDIIKDMRKQLLCKKIRNDFFTYILTEANLEVKGSYRETDLQIQTYAVLQKVAQIPRYTIQSLQLEIPKKIAKIDLQQHLWDFFQQKNYSVEKDSGHVYDRNGTHVYETYVQINRGIENSVAIIVLMSKN
jgi:hypothetical protein